MCVVCIMYIGSVIMYVSSNFMCIVINGFMYTHFDNIQLVDSSR